MTKCFGENVRVFVSVSAGVTRERRVYGYRSLRELVPDLAGYNLKRIGEDVNLQVHVISMRDVSKGTLHRHSGFRFESNLKPPSKRRVHFIIFCTLMPVVVEIFTIHTSFISLKIVFSPGER